MPKHHKELSENERQKLVELRDKGEPAYLRERAAALLKIHEGSSPHKVALKGLLKKRDPDTLHRRYRENGIQGLSHKPGRGRKPAFSPKSSEEAEWRSSIPSDDPGQVNVHQTRWTLRTPSCRGSTMFPCRVFIKSSHDWVSAINAPEHTCGARIQTTPKKSPGSSKF